MMDIFDWLLSLIVSASAVDSSSKRPVICRVGHYILLYSTHSSRSNIVLVINPRVVVI